MIRTTVQLYYGNYGMVFYKYRL